MSKIIESLTPEQESSLEGYYEKWLAIGLDTKPANREATEAAITKLYENEGFKKPSFFWVLSPKELVKASAFIEYNGRAPTPEELNSYTETSKDGICYGYHDSGWLSSYDVFSNELKLEEECKDIQPLLEIAKNCGWWVPFDDEGKGSGGICVCSERHSVLKLNESGDPHCFDGPAIVYPDGYSLYFFNGLAVTKEYAEMKPEDFTSNIILSEKNADIRRELIRKIGNEKAASLMNAKTLNSAFGYDLLNIDIDGERTRPFLRMKNPSMDTIHVEGVTAECETVMDAIKFRNGKDKLPATLDGIPAKDIFPGVSDDLIGNYHQQGDALFEMIDSIPENAKKKDNMVAVEGLRRHVAQGKDVIVFEGFLSAPNGVTIIHPEHGKGSVAKDTVLAPGHYLVTQVQEYDHWLEEQRTLID